MKNIQYFVGKVCTVFVGNIARDFNPEQFSNYFVGKVEAIDEKGILTAHVGTGCKNYFLLNNVIGIAEEQLLYPDDPEDAKVIEKSFKKPMSNKNNLLDIANLEKTLNSVKS